LGELITLIEDDKRSGNENAMAVTLPYSGDIFTVPNNLYIIGTMNTADRSIALLDVALRRRFAFVEIMPRPELLLNEYVETEEEILSLQILLTNLNTKISKHISRDHQLGHSYLLQIAGSPQEERLLKLEYIWNNQIYPLLKEYYYGREDQFAELLSNIISAEKETLEEEVNAFEIAHQTGEQLVFLLSQL